MMTLNDKDLLRQQAWIDGQWTDARSGKTIAVTNPADGSTLGSVPSVSDAEVREAIDAADAALPAWRRLTAKERSEDAPALVSSDDGTPG